MAKLSNLERRLLAFLGPGVPIGLTGIGAVVAADGLVRKGMAEVTVGKSDTLTITDVGRRALAETDHE